MTFTPHIEWHSSEEEGPPDVGQMLYIEDDESGLWVGEITRREFEEHGDIAENCGESDGGWWIVRHHKGGRRELIGKVADADAAMELQTFVLGLLPSHTRAQCD